jgi:lipid-A-disaccharide synthase
MTRGAEEAAGASHRGKRLLICTAEPSGERLASQLIPILRRDYPGVQIWTLGGAILQQMDVYNLHSTTGLGAVGVLEALPKAYAAKRMREAFAYALRRWDPDLVLTVDSPSLMLPLCRIAKASGHATCHWVGPQVWAWRASRIPRVAASVDRILCLFPHEPEAFNAAGGDACWVGHPATRAPFGPRSASYGTARFGLAPGSRESEIRRLWPRFCEAAKVLRQTLPQAEFVVACAPGMDKTRYTGISGLQYGTTEDLHMTGAVLACSGTVTLELALAGVPTVAAYRLSRISYAVARRLVRGVKYIALPNILLDEPLLPEHIQQLSPKQLAADLIRCSERQSEFHAGAVALRRLLNKGDPLENTSEALTPWLAEEVNACH